MTDQERSNKIVTGAFIGPGELKNRPDKGQEKEAEKPKRSETNDKATHKSKLLWVILLAIILVVVICIIVIPRRSADDEKKQGGVVRTKYTDNGFVLENCSLKLVNREYYKDGSERLKEVCENIDKYSQAFTVNLSEVLLKDINSKALISELRYKQNKEGESDLSFAIIDPVGKETISSKEKYLLKEGETVFVNLDNFFDNEVIWRTGSWHIIVLIDDKEVVDYQITILE